MTDVRLTALNPEDSQAYPVACNSSGELLVSKGDESDRYVEKSGDNMSGDLTLGTDKITLNADGSGSFGSGNISLNADGSGSFGSGISLNADGSALFAGGRIKLNADGTLETWRSSGDANSDLQAWESNIDTYKSIKARIRADGSATFSGDVTVGSRNRNWMIVEQSGLAHLVEQTSKNGQYPTLRDIPGELDLIEKALSEVMEKLRLVPPAGWPVWDGSDETQ